MRTSHLNQGVCILPLTERPKFERRYSSIAGLFFASRLLTAMCWNFFEKPPGARARRELRTQNTARGRAWLSAASGATLVL
jgi:hypothetical protein